MSSLSGDFPVHVHDVGHDQTEDDERQDRVEDGAAVAEDEVGNGNQRAADTPGDGGRDRPDDHLGFYVGDAHHAVDHPVEAVVEVAEEERAHGGSVGGHQHVDTFDFGEYRHGDGGAGDHGDGARTLDEAHQGGDDEGDHDRREGQVLGDVLGHFFTRAAVAQDGAECATGTGHEQDDACTGHAFFEVFGGVMHACPRQQGIDGDQHADGERNDGVTDKSNGLVEGTSLEGFQGFFSREAVFADEINDGFGEDEDNRQDAVCQVYGRGQNFS